MPRRFREYDGIPPKTAYVIPYHVTIAALCLKCGHAAELTRDELKRRNLAYREFTEYQHRLICGQCGTRGAKITTGDFHD